MKALTLRSLWSFLRHLRNRLRSGDSDRRKTRREEDNIFHCFWKISALFWQESNCIFRLPSYIWPPACRTVQPCHQFPCILVSALNAWHVQKLGFLRNFELGVNHYIPSVLLSYPCFLLYHVLSFFHSHTFSLSSYVASQGFCPLLLLYCCLLTQLSELLTRHSELDSTVMTVKSAI